MEITLQGIGVSPGIAIGPVRTFQVDATIPTRHTIADSESEIARFDAALSETRDELQALGDQVNEELGAQHAAIFQAHLAMLEDPALGPEIHRRIREEALNADYLLHDLVRGYEDIFARFDDSQFRERSADLVDVGRRILDKLLDRDSESLEQLDGPCVIVAHKLTPSETVNMDMVNTMGIATDGGGPTSHMAILARAFEIPTVVGLRHIGSRVTNGDPIIVDGGSGRVIVRPARSTLTAYETRQRELVQQRQALLEVAADGPPRTLDGTEIQLLANIELLTETTAALKSRCQGVGLYRTEYLFLDRPSAPTEEEQYITYKRVVETMAPLPVTVRTLDLGGDKILPGTYEELETNPQLGWRSIRLCLDRPDIFKAQLRALLRASVHGEVRIMFPMITGVDQLRDALEVVDQVKADLRARKVPFRDDVKVGSMIEVPAAVAIADKLANECDFLSVGTNDLIQYCLAVDRVNERTAHLYNPIHPAVLRMLKQTVEAARKAQKPCTLCGEMAGDPRLTELLIGIGFRNLSMSGAALPEVRLEVVHTRLTTARSFARRVLSMGAESEIDQLLKRRLGRRVPVPTTVAG